MTEEVKNMITGFGAKYYKANGNDFFDVYDKTKLAIENIKEHKQPVVLECVVFRHMAHSAPICDDKIGYRELDKPENREKEDSVKNLRIELLKEFSELDIILVEDEVNLQVKSAMDFGVNSSYPEHEELYKDVYHV